MVRKTKIKTNKKARKLQREGREIGRGKIAKKIKKRSQ